MNWNEGLPPKDGKTYLKPGMQAQALMELLVWLHDSQPDVYRQWLAKI